MAKRYEVTAVNRVTNTMQVEYIDADFFIITNGNLLFGNTGYESPDGKRTKWVIASYAYGCWARVIELESE